MQGIKRRIVYISLFEIIGVALSTLGLAFVLGRNIEQSGIVATISSVMAICWNLIYNIGFEYFESRFGREGRPLSYRLAHAIGFEIGLALMVTPMIAFVLNISMGTALLTNIGIMLFFMFYTLCFSTAFDKVFGLPLSALPKVSSRMASEQ